MRIRSQSASVFGACSTVPAFVNSILTASKWKSEAGWSMSRISSCTDTTGLRSPQSAAAPGAVGAGACGARFSAGPGFDDEQAETTAEASIAASAARARRTCAPGIGDLHHSRARIGDQERPVRSLRLDLLRRLDRPERAEEQEVVRDLERPRDVERHVDQRRPRKQQA